VAGVSRARGAGSALKLWNRSIDAKRSVAAYSRHVLVVTTDSLPGFEIRAVLGEVLGVTACTRNPYAAGFRILDGHQGAEMAQVLVQSRASAIAQMINAARRRGADAVVGMRFDNRDITGNWVELCAYGTAVTAVPVTEEARRQQAGAEADRVRAAQQAPSEPQP
jgi:uncharacterized protein YbjQ (UPF0145 family)